MGKSSILRSLVAGALIGLTEAAPLNAVRPPRPLQVVWIDDRDLPDPLDELPLLLLDPAPLPAPVDEARPSGLLSVALASPRRFLRRYRSRFLAG